MSRARLPEHRGLPPRWTIRRKKFYYQVPECMRAQWDNKTLFPLGENLSSAFRVFAERIGEADTAITTIAALLDRYEIEVVPTKAAKTQHGNHYQIATLKKALGPSDIRAIKPQVIYQYMDRRSAKIAARREIALLSHALTKAVKWGIIEKHPFKGEMEYDGEKARTRYIEDWELEACLALPKRKGGNDATEFLQHYLRVKMLTGLRQGDMLRLRVTDFNDIGIPVTTSKTGKRIVIQWTPALRAAVDAAKAARPVHISPWLFCNRRGACYVNEATGEASGFKSMWQRFMIRVLDETKVTERFTEHDIRAKVGSDAESPERAQSLLTHDNVGITKRSYRRRAEIVAPLY